MPRSGINGTYSLPGAQATQVPGTPIPSAVNNQGYSDIEQTFNTPQPIAYGGTGATTAVGGADALSPAFVNVASSATTNIGAAASPNVTITGNTGITAFDNVAAGIRRHGYFSGTPTLTHNAVSLILPGTANINAAAGDSFEAVSLGSGNWKVTDYNKISGQAVGGSSPPKFYIFGLTLTNNATDAANDIDISAGEASSDASTPILIALPVALVKRLDAAWAVGTNQGMLDAGSVANSTYYLWLIRRSDTGVVDVLASLSNTSPTMPTSYDQKRLIGAVIRASGANAAPVEFGAPSFTRPYSTPQLAITTAGLLILSHPLGSVPPIVTAEYVCITGEIGYTAGETIQANIQGSAFASENAGLSVRKTSTQLIVKYGDRTSPLLSIRADTGVIANMTNANWRLVLRAWA